MKPTHSMRMSGFRLRKVTSQRWVIPPIGAPGFEPGTSPTRTVRATGLRHAPNTPMVLDAPGSGKGETA